MYEQPNQHKTSRIVSTLITTAVIILVAFILWWLYQSFFSTQTKTNTNSTNQTAGITMSDKDFTAKLESAIRDLGYDDKYVKLNTANWATTPQQGNILISGSVTANSFIGNGSSLTNLNANNVTSGTISTNLLPGSGSITCPSGVGNLTGGGNQATLGGAACGAISIITNPTFSLVTSTNIATNNLNTITLASNSISSTNINSTNLSSANLTTTNLNAQTIATNNLNTNAITATSATINGNATVTGSLTANTVTATSLAGDGLALTNLNADNIASGTLAVSQGGTGANSFILNGLLYGDGTNPIKSLAPGNSSQCLVTTTSGGAPQWGSCSAGGGVTAPNPGTNNTIAMFTGTNTIANSLLSQDVGATTVTANGSLQVNGNANITGTMVGASTIQGASLISTVTTGTAPLQVTSTTKVANLNADLLDGYTASDFAQASSLGNYVLKAGDTMSGNLNMGTNKLIGGTGVTDVLKLQGTTGNGTSTSPAIQLLTGNNGATTALTVLNNGNVGIGTTTPNSKLHVSTGNDSNSGEIAIAIGGTANNNARQAQIVKNTSANYELKIISGMNAVNGSALTFETSPGTEKMRLTGSGEFGIGTNNPTAKLQVDSTTTTLVGAIIKATAAQTADMLQIRNSSGTVMSAFDSAGKLAINTTSTSSALTVKGTSSVATVGTSNLLTADGTFATDSGWTIGTGWTTGGQATHTTGNTATLSGTTTATSTSTVYQVNFNVTQTTAGSGFSVSLGGKDSGTTINTAGAKTLYIKPSAATGTLVFTPIGTGDWVGTIDDVTIYAIANTTPDVAIQSSNGATYPLEVRSGSDGLFNLNMGYLTGRTNTTGNNNTAVGTSALVYNTIGSYNSAFGRIALLNNTTGNHNSAFGYYALQANTTGIANTGVGSQTLAGNISGGSNTGVGYASLYNNTTGGGNVGVGYSTLINSTTGGSNVALGAYSGAYYSTSSALTNISNSVFVGYNTRASADGNTNEVVIGYGTIGNGSNSVTLGNTSITKTILQGNVGIGTATPNVRLEVVGPVADFPVTSGTTQTAGALRIKSASGSNGILDIGGNGASGVWLQSTNASNLALTYPLLLNPNGGNVGIGTTTPTTKLEVVGGVDGAESDVLTLKSNFTTTGTATTLRFVNSTVSTNDTVSSEISSIRQANGADLTLRTGDGGGMQNRLYIQGNTGNVGIGTTSPSYLLHVGSSSTTAGTAVAHFQNADGTCTINPSISGSVSCTSDERLKKDITKLDTTTTLDKLLGISTISYHMNNDTNDSPLKVGFSAQQLETILPDLVVTNADGYKSVSYAGLTPYLVAGLQAQQQTINSLKQDIQTLQAATGINSNQVTIANLNVSGPTTLTDLTVNGNLNVTGNLTLAGTLTVKDLTLTNNLTINGHIITAGNTPTITPLPAAGQGATATIEGNDTSGTITLVAGQGSIVGDVIDTTFAQQFGSTPRIILTPVGPESAKLQAYINNPNASSFMVGGITELIPGQTYTFNYQVMQ